MALTDQEIEDFADANGHACAIVHGEMGREVIWYDGDLTPFARAIEAAATAPLLERIAALEAQVEQAAQPSEQAAFEDWLHRVCPSGDVTDVKRQWEASSDLAEWLESQRTEDVLIDGVAYTVPIEVACELLHLHMALLTKPAQAAQPVMVQFRWTNPGDNPNPTEDEMKWHEVVPNFKWQTVQDRIAALLAYQYNGKPCYEIRSLYAAPPKAVPLTDEQQEKAVSDLAIPAGRVFSIRAAFEDWYSDGGKSPKAVECKPGDPLAYILMGAQSSWAAWFAGVKALEAWIAEGQASKAVPLTQPEKQRLWNDATYNNRSSTTDAAMEYGSAIEAAHGITPATVEKGA